MPWRGKISLLPTIRFSLVEPVCEEGLILQLTAYTLRAVSKAVHSSSESLSTALHAPKLRAQDLGAASCPASSAPSLHSTLAHLLQTLWSSSCAISSTCAAPLSISGWAPLLPHLLVCVEHPQGLPCPPIQTEHLAILPHTPFFSFLEPIIVCH